MQYFSRDGRLLSEREALDERGILRDGVICRTRLTMRDGVQHHPGFASSGTTFNDWVGRDAKRESYRDYDTALTNAWRKPSGKLADAAAPEEEDDTDQIPCPECDGSGEIDGGVECTRCGGEGSIPAMIRATSNDKRSIDQIARDHARHMDQIYQNHARSLSEPWRKAAVLARLVRKVCSVEIIPPLAEAAAKLGYGNVSVKVGDGYHGWPECGPFDAMIVTAALGHVPPPLIEQLKVGGRLVMPLGPADAPQQLTVIEKIAPSETRIRSIFLVHFVPFTRSQD
jgi:hypothetical protein